MKICIWLQVISTHQRSVSSTSTLSAITGQSPSAATIFRHRHFPATSRTTWYLLPATTDPHGCQFLSSTASTIPMPGMAAFPSWSNVPPFITLPSRSRLPACTLLSGNTIAANFRARLFPGATSFITSTSSTTFVPTSTSAGLLLVFQNRPVKNIIVLKVFTEAKLLQKPF